MFVRKYIVLVCVMFLFLVSGVISKPIDEKMIEYLVAPLFEKNVARLKVKLAFKGNTSGKTQLKLPNKFASRTELYKQINNLSLETKNSVLKDTKLPEIKIIEHRPDVQIQISYEVEQKDESVTSAGRGGGYAPIFQKDYLHFIGEGVWVAPKYEDDTKMKVNLKWREIPDEWELANSFGVNQKEQTFSTTLPKLSSAIFVAGDYRIVKKEVKGRPVFTAVRGEWKFTDEEIADLVHKTVKIQRDFWRDYEHPFYLVTLLPLKFEGGRRSFGGTGLTNSFATFVTNNIPAENLQWLIAHEYFHNWNYLSFGGLEEPQELLYWFSEGFTDYYTALLLLRGGFYDLDKFLAKHNELTSDYYLSPVRNVDNQRIRKDFFNDIRVTHQAYRRGFLLATKWNRTIQLQTKGKKSLDNVMWDILRDAKSEKYKKLSKDLIIGYLSRYAQYDFRFDIDKYIENGETIDGFEKPFGDCVEVETQKMGRYELGWDFESSRKNDWKIVGVNENSAAFKKGVRNGQRVGGLQLNSGNVSQPVKITVVEEGQRKEISYLPVTEEKIDVPQYRMKDGVTKSQNQDCLKKMGVT